MKEEERHIAAFDLGTAKIALTVARVYLDDIQIIYYKEVPSDGIRNSSIFNPIKVEKPIRTLVKEAEKELGIKITQAVIGMPRHAVRMETATARADRDENSCISQEEVDNLKSMAIDSYPLDDAKNEFLYGSVAQSFSTEEEFNQIESDIVGMVSPFLEGNFKIFIGKKRAVSNIDMAFNKLGIAITKKYFVPDVTAKAVLTNDEMENGVALIDFGAGVTSVSIYKNKIMRHYAAIPFAGRSITNDIRNEGGLSESLAENIKLAFGALMPDKLQTLSEKIIQINDENDLPVKQVAVKYLSEIMTARTKEIYDALLYEIQESGYADQLASGIVITGGSASMANCSNFLKEMSGYNVRLGFARKFFSSDGIQGIGETSATVCLGMILAAKRDMLPNCTILSEEG
nr:cell division protein FtsA [Bacteroidales bacterium]